MEMPTWGQTLVATATQLGLKVLGAIALWIVGRQLIDLVVRLVSGALRRQNVDPTLLRYVGATITVVLSILLVIALLGLFGVETTTFAALLAGAGLAVGTAWGGLLANFAAGAFLVVLRPFKVGDFIAAGGITGTVEEVGLFATTINTPDNVRTPPPDVELLEFTPMGPGLAVRPYCDNQHYWQVYFDANRVIRETFAEARYPAPEQLFLVRSGT